MPSLRQAPDRYLPLKVKQPSGIKPPIFLPLAVFRNFGKRLP